MTEAPMIGAALPELPTLAECIFFYAMTTGRTFRGGEDGYQMDMLRAIVNNERLTVQAPRQAGTKTETVALWAATALQKGCAGLMGMPAMNQSAKVTRKRIVDFMKAAERLGWNKCTSPAILNTTWNTGGALEIVSAHQAVEQERRKSSQPGRTVQFAIFDEGANLFDEDVRELIPAVTIAETEGKAKIIIPGVGGPSDSIIEAKKQAGYASYWIDDVGVLAQEPKFTPFFEQMRAENTSEFYDANYRCLPLTLGQRKLYPEMVAPAPLPPHAGTPLHVFGIDVGRTRDFTCIAHMIHYPAIGRWHLFAFKQIPHGNLADQARWVFEYIDQFPWVCDRFESHIACETNGVSYGLHDMLVRLHELDHALAGFPYITKVNVNHDNIHRTVQSLRVRIRNGELEVHADARTARLGDPPKRLDELHFSMNERGDYKYDHHDGHSALIVASLGYEKIESA